MIRKGFVVLPPLPDYSAKKRGRYSRPVGSHSPFPCGPSRTPSRAFSFPWPSTALVSGPPAHKFTLLSSVISFAPVQVFMVVSLQCPTWIWGRRASSWDYCSRRDSSLVSRSFSSSFPFRGMSLANSSPVRQFLYLLACVCPLSTSRKRYLIRRLQRRTWMPIGVPLIVFVAFLLSLLMRLAVLWHASGLPPRQAARSVFYTVLTIKSSPTHPPVLAGMSFHSSTWPHTHTHLC